MRTLLGSTKRKFAQFLVLFCCLAVFSSLTYPTKAFANSKYAGIVMDAKTGKVLYSRSADSYRYPASLTKMMTLYMMFDAMERRKLSKSTRIRMSRHAATMQPSKLGIRAGGTITAEQAIYALVTKSANDVAAAVAEHLGGTESNFGVLMTKKARSIGMKRTTFKNASGLPNRKQVTTARDMARLGIALREHYPQYYKYFKTRSFKYGRSNFRNHNKLLGTIRGVDGIKTGYTRASGYNLVSSVYDRKRSIVAVVLGGRSGRSRNAQMATLIKKYLPRASTGRDRTIVAKARSKSVFASVFKKPKKVTVPEKRALHISSYAVRKEEIKSVSKEIASLSVMQIPIPTRNPIAKPDPVKTASVKKEIAVKAPVTASAIVSSSKTSSSKPAKGWQIQIGAVPSVKSANEFLEKARKVAPKTLRNVKNYTMEIDKNGTKLYRARFAGFSSKSAAWNACKALKKKFSCLALAN